MHHRASLILDNSDKHIVFCSENLSKDLYLISQMDSDNFVPIWAVACMEDIKALTADVDLIVDVLQGISAATLLFYGPRCSKAVSIKGFVLVDIKCPLYKLFKI